MTEPKHIQNTLMIKKLKSQHIWSKDCWIGGGRKYPDDKLVFYFRESMLDTDYSEYIKNFPKNDVRGFIEIKL